MFFQALREELASAEQTAEEGHATNNATKVVSNLNYLFVKFLCFALYFSDFVIVEKAAMERKVELEHKAVESFITLTRI